MADGVNLHRDHAFADHFELKDMRQIHGHTFKAAFCKKYKKLKLVVVVVQE